MTELSIFIDESGDFGKYSYNSPFYLITFIFHDQKYSVSNSVRQLEQALSLSGYNKNTYIHIGPAIRRENEFKSMSLNERRKLVGRLVSFSRSIKYLHYTFEIKKTDIESTKMIERFIDLISCFLINNLSEFQNFSTIKIYYDGGQKEIKRIIKNVFKNNFSNVEIKNNISPTSYRLFQIADLVCTFELIRRKMQLNILSSSEKRFFGSNRYLKKNYLDQIDKKLFKGRF